MYPEGARTILTSAEEILEEVTSERLLEILLNPKVVLVDSRRSTNSYGEFRFVTLGFPGSKGLEYLTFYGLGYHEYRDRYLDHFRFFRTTLGSHWNHPQRSALLRILKEEAEDYKKLAAEHEPDFDGQIYGMLAEMGDEDSAISDLEDFFAEL